jgi:hypothetical protein
VSFHDISEDLDPTIANYSVETITKILQILKKESIPEIRDELKKVSIFKNREYDVHDTNGPKPSNLPAKNEYLDLLHIFPYTRMVPQIPFPCPLIETITGTGFTFNTAMHFSKKYGGGVQLNGSSYVTVANDPILNVTDEIGIALWLYSPATSNDRVILAKNNQYEIKLTSGNGISWRVYSGGAWKTARTTTFTSNTWTHIAATYKSTGSGQKLYKNASLASSDSETGAIGTSSNALGIMHNGSGSNILLNNTRLAHLSLLHKELTSGWITDHYNGKLDTRAAPEIVTYPFTVSQRYETDMHPGNFIPH